MNAIDAAWRKSSYSGSNGGACVEVGSAGLAVRSATAWTRIGHGWLSPRTRGRRLPSR